VVGKLLKRSADGIIYNDHEAGAIGPLLFEQACKMGLEGIVSKHRERGYKAGPCKDWIKVKNPKSAAMIRAKEGRLVNRPQKVTLGKMRRDIERVA